VSANLPPASEGFCSLLSDKTFRSEFTIFPEEVEASLLRFNTYKAQGVDALPTWLLKDCATSSANPSRRCIMPLSSSPRPAYLEICAGGTSSKSAASKIDRDRS